jgi:hypothetical protein
MSGMAEAEWPEWEGKRTGGLLFERLSFRRPSYRARSLSFQHVRYLTKKGGQAHEDQQKE